MSADSKQNAFLEENLGRLPEDNRRLLEKIKERFDRVELNLPTVEVRFKNLSVEANCQLVRGKPLPTLFNELKSSIHEAVKGVLRIFGVKFREAKITILRDVSGIIKPSKMTLLLGPPGCGKTTLLCALAGRLDQSLKVKGEVTYNGFRFNEFIPQKTSAYVSQYDLHMPELTVRETFDFSARCQGVGRRGELLTELEKREEEAGIIADPDLVEYMKAAISIDGIERSPQIDYVLKILALETCSNSVVGDAMRRSISGGEKKRVTLGEMIVGPHRTFFMDEISNGLDSSTTFQIISCFQQFAQIMETTMLISLLQPAPEVFKLFDEIILMAEGMIIYNGPRVHVLEFFENCGFRCPERKSPADFLHEVISKKDQGKFWCHSDHPYHYVPVENFAERFKAFSVGQKSREELSQLHCMLNSGMDALSFRTYSLSKRELLKACCSREWLLTKRSPFAYVLKLMQLMFLALVTMTVFMRTEMRVDLVHANYYMGVLFYTILLFMVNSNPELYVTLSRLPVFYKQRDSYLYPAWAFSLPSSVMKIPHSLVASLLWTLLTYYAIGYSPEADRFFCQFLLFFVVHLMAASLQRAIASLFRSSLASITAAAHALMISVTFAGFILPLPSIPDWMTWGFWISPLSYAEEGATVNEFQAPRWKLISSGNLSIGEEIMRRRGLPYKAYVYWVSLGALFGFIVVLNIVFTLALTFLRRKFSLPFEPLSLSFQGVQYFVNTPLKMTRSIVAQKNIQLLRDVTGAFMPHVLTALMGVSGAGKTTLLDVLSGRTTYGTIQGDIRIGGYPKSQETFSRVSAYCEQNDIHSPHITVEESVIHSAWLRLGPEINEKTKMEFVNEVMETVELDEIKDALVGNPGSSGLSMEQRKRLTFAVELVSNPSIMFIDEPTTGLDARAAAVVMRAVKNLSSTGRTVVSTIHQPSIDIFESFDEIVLLKEGGQIIYSDPLGLQSKNIIDYFESIQGVPKFSSNSNPATWMLEVTSTSMERHLDIDFAQIYKESLLYQETKMLVEQLNKPPPGSKQLDFPTRFSVNGWGQFTTCLWKLWLSYWRSPEYNLRRISISFYSSLFFGFLFWNVGRNINTEQDLFHIEGFMFCATLFIGVSNCKSVQDFVLKERLVMYRERFVGMYSSLSYSVAQVAIELPYVFGQAIVSVSITYLAAGFQLSVSKFIWYFSAMFFSNLTYTYTGMLMISLSPNTQVSSIYSSIYFTMSSLFSGFIIPRPQIPGWWIWCYWISPPAWPLNAFMTSQYGDMKKEIEVLGEHKRVDTFLKDYFGFQWDELPLVAVVLVGFPFFIVLLFAIGVAKLNFQLR